MCIALPVKVIAIGNKEVIIEDNNRQKKVNGSLAKVRVGDYVILQNNMIVGKISKKEARETLELMNPVRSLRQKKFN